MPTPSPQHRQQQTAIAANPSAGMKLGSPPIPTNYLLSQQQLTAAAASSGHAIQNVSVPVVPIMASPHHPTAPQMVVPYMYLPQVTHAPGGLVQLAVPRHPGQPVVMGTAAQPPVPVVTAPQSTAAQRAAPMATPPTARIQQVPPQQQQQQQHIVIAPQPGPSASPQQPLAPIPAGPQAPPILPAPLAQPQAISVPVPIAAPPVEQVLPTASTMPPPPAAPSPMMQAVPNPMAATAAAESIQTMSQESTAQI